jgi:hypothetical protein
MAAVIAEAQKRVPYFTTEVTVDVEIDPDDLHHAGWHHENECPAKPAPVSVQCPTPLVTLAEAVASLHAQAHLDQDPDAAMCRREPCRFLTLDQVRGWLVA